MKYEFSIFNFQFSIFSQPPCCFATSPLTKGGKPPQATTHCSSSLRDFIEVVAIHKPQKTNAKTEKKKKSLSFTPFVIAKAEGLWQSINHKKLMQKQKRKKIHYYFKNKNILLLFFIFH